MAKKLDLQELILAYLDTQKNNWSENTLRSEKYRLRGVTLEMLMEPELLWKFFKAKGSKPYAIKTAFIRAGEVFEYLMEKGHLPRQENPPKAFMKSEAKRFKHAYNPAKVEMTFEEACERIGKIENDVVREKAIQLLGTGMRYEESTKVGADGKVVGKGGYEREVPLAKELAVEGFDISYATVLRHLKKVGITPHMLRKLCATKHVAEGAQEADLMKLMGWRTSQMAAVYVQERRANELAEKMRQSLPKKKKKEKGSKTDGK